MHHARARHHRLVLPFLAFLVACSPKPSREEALAAIQAAYPAVDTTTVFSTVWRDGPPWFSCAEVMAKLRRRSDEATVRDTLGNWLPLSRSGWAVPRDTAAGEVTEPGWCVLAIADSAAGRVATWYRLVGDSVPSGGRRRGWRFVAGQRRIILLDRPDAAGRDSAIVDFGITVQANEHGRAAGADRDTTRLRALLHRDDDRWRMIGIVPAASRE